MAKKRKSHANCARAIGPWISKNARNSRKSRCASGWGVSVSVTCSSVATAWAINSRETSSRLREPWVFRTTTSLKEWRSPLGLRRNENSVSKHQSSLPRKTDFGPRAPLATVARRPCSGVSQWTIRLVSPRGRRRITMPSDRWAVMGRSSPDVGRTIEAGWPVASLARGDGCPPSEPIGFPPASWSAAAPAPSHRIRAGAGCHG